MLPMLFLGWKVPIGPTLQDLKKQYFAMIGKRFGFELGAFVSILSQRRH